MEDRVVVRVGHRRRVEAAPSDGVAGGLARRRSVIAKVSPITDQWMDGHRIDDRRPRQGRRAEGQRTDRRGGESTSKRAHERWVHTPSLFYPAVRSWLRLTS